jgi:hypothetical protein
MNSYAPRIQIINEVPYGTLRRLTCRLSSPCDSTFAGSRSFHPRNSSSAGYETSRGLVFCGGCQSTCIPAPAGLQFFALRFVTVCHQTDVPLCILSLGLKISTHYTLISLGRSLLFLFTSPLPDSLHYYFRFSSSLPCIVSLLLPAGRRGWRATAAASLSHTQQNTSISTYAPSPRARRSRAAEARELRLHARDRLPEREILHLDEVCQVMRP